MALTSPNWCTEAGAGGNLQECQLSISEALFLAHLIKGQIDGPAGSGTSIRKGQSGSYGDYRVGWTTRLKARCDGGAFFDHVNFFYSFFIIMHFFV